VEALDVAIAVAVVAVLAGLALFARWVLLSRRRSLGSAEDRATYQTLHTAALAAPALRSGLDAESASSSSTAGRRRRTG
jgi:two-component system LytT family sensor kinase